MAHIAGIPFEETLLMAAPTLSAGTGLMLLSLRRLLRRGPRTPSATPQRDEAAVSSPAD